ncbi:MAG: class I SAM-dependent methyltransferase [Bryobacteraceae bacterium]|jgi:SAM-dependent methyltransferase
MAQVFVVADAQGTDRKLKYNPSMTVLANEGYCPICESAARFEATQDWLRDWYVCMRCGTIPRQRAVVEILNLVAPGWKGMTVHESSPNIRFFAEQCSGYTYSNYFEGVPLGSREDGMLCENLESLTFPDSAFDVFITQDVLEHVFNPALAVREIARVLKPNGVHVFTTPKYKHLLQSRQRARLLKDGSVEHLLPEEYHGNPIGDGRSLVAWDYGADLDDLLGAWSGYLVSDYVLRDHARGIAGEYLDVFVMRKDERNRTG